MKTLALLLVMVLLWVGLIWSVLNHPRLLLGLTIATLALIAVVDRRMAAR
jgi:hypothetical protein